MALQVAEKFFSVQGEGATVGTPAYFIRLQGCNLMCGGSNASLVKEGKATWHCDTEAIWKKGITTSNEELEKAIDEACGIDNVVDGRVHLVWTGGEPALPRSRTSIIEFIDYFTNKYSDNMMYNEIETNGTVYVDVDDDKFYGTGFNAGSICVIDQINCSPKLSNSGMHKRNRINSKAISQICNHNNYWFKFVISKEDDLKEIETDFIIPFDIDPTRVILMPACNNAKDLPEATRFLYEMAKKYKYRAVTRQHIIAYDKQTGV